MNVSAMTSSVAGSVPLKSLQPADISVPAVLAMRAYGGAGFARDGASGEGEAEAGSLDAQIRALSDALRETWLNVEFSIDHDTNKIVTKIVDRDTGEVVRQIPTEEMMQVARTFTKLQGLLVNQSA